MRFHCFFEQSGTFKNEFKKLGYEAYDYDILNDFGETDYVVDLFKDIEDAYTHTHTRTVFDNVKEDDQIIAFFPCTRFENQIMLSFRGQAYQMEKWDMKQKMEYDMKLMQELERNYMLVNKLMIVCIERGLKLIMENPYSEEHFLRRYWCFLPSVIDKDRRERGDYFKKPTQYWFLNRKPSNNLIFEAYANNALDSIELSPKQNYVEWKDAWNRRRMEEYAKTGAKNYKVGRSMIHPDYANRFIREFII